VDAADAADAENNPYSSEKTPSAGQGNTMISDGVFFVVEFRAFPANGLTWITVLRLREISLLRLCRSGDRRFEIAAINLK
jgi:hypothetical protein